MYVVWHKQRIQKKKLVPKRQTNVYFSTASEYHQFIHARPTCVLLCINTKVIIYKSFGELCLFTNVIQATKSAYLSSSVKLQGYIWNSLLFFRLQFFNEEIDLNIFITCTLHGCNFKKTKFMKLIYGTFINLN